MAKDTGFNLWDSIFHTRKEQPEEQQLPSEKTKTFPKTTLPEKPEWLKQRAQQEKCREDVILEQARTKMTKNLRSEYEAAIKLLKTIPGWKTADGLLAQCQQALADRTAIEAAERQRQQKQSARNRRRLILGSVIVLAAFCLATGVVTFISYRNSPEYIAEKTYKKAIELKNEGKYVEAYGLFLDVEDYKDSRQLMEEMTNLDGTIKDPAFVVPQIHVGDILRIGSYEQDGDAYKKEPIQWQVLEIQGERALVISRQVLSSRIYDSPGRATDWSKSGVRFWLNEAFLVENFTERERQLILATEVQVRRFEGLFNVGENTRDGLFLLDLEEANRYFGTDQERKTTATTFAKNKGVTDNRWWLRTMGRNAFDALFVDGRGAIDRGGKRAATAGIGIRPAMWIDVTKLTESAFS